MIFDADIRVAHGIAEDVFPGQTIRVALCPSPRGWYAVVVGDDRGRDLVETTTVETPERALGALIDMLREAYREQHAAE